MKKHKQILLKFKSFLLKKTKKTKKQPQIEPIKFYKGKSYDLLIFDDLFPYPYSGFRLEEFTQILTNFKSSKILLSDRSYKYLGIPDSIRINNLITFKEKYNFQSQILDKPKEVNINCKLFYCIFLNNIYLNLNWLEKYKVPFVFTLYPGGGFNTSKQESLEMLKKVLSSPLLKRVIVTQKYTKDFLLEKSFCSESKIEFIYGGIVPQSSTKLNFNRDYYKIGKVRLDICFCASKYMPLGIDKGYDVFVGVAKEIIKNYNFIDFHVIGNFTKEDIELSDIPKKRFFLYGKKEFNELSNIFRNMDVILSPNKPFALSKGSFDGFPLGAVVEAVFNGCLALISDELNQNHIFEEYKDFIKIKPNINDICKEIEKLIASPEDIKRISENGREKFIKVFSNENQLKDRINLLKGQILN